MMATMGGEIVALFSGVGDCTIFLLFVILPCMCVTLITRKQKRSF